MGETRGMEQIARLDKIRGREPELRVFPAARRPLPGPFRMQAHAKSDHRLHRHLLRHAEHMHQLFQLLDDQDDFFSQLSAQQRILDETRVLVAVADHETVGIRVQRKRGQQLRLAPRLDAEMPGQSRIHDLLHHLAKLVHLDRKNPAIHPAIAHLRNRIRKRRIDNLDAVPQQVVKTDHERKLQRTRPRLAHNLHQVNLLAIPLGLDDDMAVRVDPEIPPAPAVHIVKCQGVPDFKIRHVVMSLKGIAKAPQR